VKGEEGPENQHVALSAFLLRRIILTEAVASEDLEVD
jgi:hypothetical protein